MTPGVPGAGVGGLFYLASTLLLPFRSLKRRLRGQPDPVSSRQIWHNVAMAGGVVAALWMVGWLLAFIVPDEMVQKPGGGTVAVRTVLPVATFATGVATLMLVLGTVEIARLIQARRHHAPESHQSGAD
ncbi:MAG TPA: hypothetical protein VFD64_07325 [Gemmatimonadaceae bacterium]|nr:hypothetical protein [Gemmatimonadaceae bacterium]